MTFQEFAEKHLEPPMKARYLRNLHNPLCRHYNTDTDYRYKDCGSYLYFAFVWKYTPEGHWYWYRVERELRRGLA